MGAGNVAMVFAHWSKRGLTHRELVTLLYMANTALDADMPPIYFAGWGPLADAVGLDGDALKSRTDPDADEQAKRHAKSVEEQVRRIMQRLIKHGAVVSSGDARRGTANDYALALGPHVTFKPAGRKVSENGRRRMTWEQVQRSISPTEKEGQASTEKVGQTPPNEWGYFHRIGGHCPTEKEGPRSSYEDVDEYIEDQIQPAVQLTTAQASEEPAAFAAEIVEDDPFTEFWKHYPRKVSKRKAEIKYKAALKRASAETINAAAQQLANDPNRPELRFIKYPTTWLEGDCWNDPPYERQLTSSERRMQAGYEVMQRVANRQPMANPFEIKNWGPELEESNNSAFGIQPAKKKPATVWDTPRQIETLEHQDEYDAAHKALQHLPEDERLALFQQVDDKHPEISSPSKRAIIAHQILREQN